MRNFGVKSLLAVALVIAVAAPASAAKLLSDFSNFGLSGTYVEWDLGTYTSNPTDFQVEAFDFGGGFFNLPATINASNETTLELKLDINAANVADKMNVVLFDADGTERVYRFDGLAVGAGQTLTKNLGDFLQDNNPGATPGLDLSALTVFHLQGTFENGQPGLAMDLTFDNLALIPEPTTISLLCLAAMIGAGLTRRRRG